MSRYWSASVEEKKRKRRRYTLFILLFLFLFLMFIPDQGSGFPQRVRQLVQDVFSPAIRVTGTAMAATKSWIGSWKSARELQDENGHLKAQVERLQGLVARLEAEKKENARLKKMLGMFREFSPKARAAGVIANGSNNEPFRTVVVDKGKNEKIRKDMGVVASGHVVVGKTVHCSNTTAQIQLLTDCMSGTGALLERSRQQGVVIGKSLHLCRMKYVPKLQDVRLGEKVTTSGLDGIFPKGLLIGHVVKIEEGKGFYKEIEVEVAADFRKLEEVVIIDSRRGKS